MSADIVCRHDITQISGKVPQHVIAVPEAFTPDLAEPAVEEGHACRDCEEGYEELFLASCGLAQPRRNHRSEEIYADKRIHEPQMACQRGKIERYARKIIDCCLAVDLSPEHWQSAV